MLLNGKRIFIIEDNLVNRSIVQLLLEKNGAKVAFERWGLQVPQALEAFAPVDLILLDLMFPRGVTGYAVYDIIRDVPGFETLPIVAISAADATEATLLTKEKGFSGFISKPIDMMRFPKQIKSVLDGQAVWY